MNELEITVAAPFKHGRKERLSKMELVFYYVQDKRWMSQDQAKKLIDIAAKRNLLTKDGLENSYRFTGSLADVTIPLGFRPGDEIFSASESEKDPVVALFDDIVATTGKTNKDLAAELQEIDELFANLLLPQAAIILLAKRYRINYDAYKSSLVEASCKNQ